MPDQLDPEIKWRSLVSLFFNYIVAVHRLLTKKVGTEVTSEIQRTLIKDFWEEQAQAFIELFDLKPGNALDAHMLKRIFAALLDIKYDTEIKNADEIIDVMDYASCPFRTALEPLWEGICYACEIIGQIFINKLDPSIQHKVIVKGNTCRHITTQKKKS
ncbi:MAG: hypothetical protein HWN66_14990 [Candidatus Helarchaeota archaeon]|nr:hypothetical protein [Candidatus Helarchaeota archaeon]